MVNIHKIIGNRFHKDCSHNEEEEEDTDEDLERMKKITRNIINKHKEE